MDMDSNRQRRQRRSQVRRATDIPNAAEACADPLDAPYLPDGVDVLQDPFTGIGKPEPLKHILTGAWSQRHPAGSGSLLMSAAGE